MAWTSDGQIDLEKFSAMKFRNLGPAGMSGRITAIDVDLSNEDIIYVGAASGGVWKSVNGGISWKPIFDDMPTLSIGSIAIDQSNPDVIWVGTGEGNPRNSVNVGGGIYKSIDGGQSWKSMGLEKTKVIHRVVVHRDNPDVVYAGALGSPWGDSKDRGVYRTTDGGKTWENTLYIDEQTGPGDLVVDPHNPNHLIAGMWSHRRTPWDFVSGGDGSGMYVTYDGGDNWKKLTDKEGMPKGNLGRIGLSFAPSKKGLVYALIEAKENGLYKSNDGGNKWELVSKNNIGNRPFYYSDIFVDPSNENRIFNLFTYISLSEDGGKTFTQIADYGNGVHPDHHAFWISPTDPDYLINGNDGGATISRDRGKTWEFVDNIPVGQFYHVNIDNDFPYNVYGGMQDNGSWVGPSFVLKPGGIRNSDWQELYFGDGFDVSPFPGDSRYGYAQSQGGNIGYYDRETGRVNFVKPAHPDGEPLRYNWNAPFAQDPHSDCGIYFGSQYLHYSSDCGQNWTILSPDLTTNDTTKQKQDVSGGLTIDATNAENHTTCLSIAPSPVDKNTIWVGTDDGNLQITRDGGKNWKNVASRLSGLPSGSWLPQIEVSHKNAGEAFIVANNYRRNDYTPYAYHTTDYGESWRRIADGNNIKAFTTSIVQDDEQENLLFLGTDGGLYFSLDKGVRWQKWDEGFPSVQVRDMKIHPVYGDLVLGTFGRAFWILDDINPLRALASQGTSLLNKDLAVFQPQDAFHAYYRSYDGIRFNAQGDFVGDNKGAGSAVVSVWLKPQEKEKGKPGQRKKGGKDKQGKKGGKDKPDMKGKKKKKPQDAVIRIIDSAGDTIRTTSVKLKEGMNKVNWSLNRDGVRFPRRQERRGGNSKYAPGGRDVMPGTYKMVLSHGDHKDSATITVKLDPRIDHDMAALEAHEKLAADYEVHVQSATDSYNEIKKARKTLKVVKAVLEAQQDSTSKSLLKDMKGVEGKLDSLSNLFMDPPGLKGIQRNPNTLTATLGGVRGYMRTPWMAPGSNTMAVMNKAIKATEETTGAVDGFFNGDWKEFHEAVDALNIDLFGNMKEKE